MNPSGKKLWSFTILAGVTLAAVFGASLLRRSPVALAPTLPMVVQEAVKLEAIEWSSTASIIGLAAGTQIAWLASEEAVEDEARLIEVCDNLADASAELVQNFHRRAVSAAGMAKDVDQIEVERFFRQTLREVLPWDPESGAGQDDVFFQMPIVPLHSFILSAPALAPPGPVLQRILERLLQALTRLLQLLPPGSPAAAAVQRAIDAILALLGTTDTTAPVIQNLAPSSGTLTNDSTPAISGTVVDAGGSGVDINSVVVQLDSTPVAATKTAVNANQVNFTFIPNSALPDGLHVVSINAQDGVGNAVTGTSSFTVDAAIPLLSGPQPPDGATVTSATPVISLGWADVTSGIDLSTASIRIGDADVTSAATLSASGFTLIPSPLEPGTHTVVVRIEDHAGNAASLTWSFSYSVASDVPDPPVEALPVRLEIVSGNGQQEMTLRCLPQPLVVRAVDALDRSRPIPGVRLSIEVPIGGGQPILDRESTTTTDEGGVARFKFVLGSIPGVNTVKVHALGRDVAPVEFLHSGLQASLSDVSMPGMCNFSYSTSDFAGSGLSRLFKMRALKPDGSPLTGEVIEPIISDFNGQPPTMTIGDFMPTRARTDANGEALFAFVIAPGAPVGAFTMRFTLPRYLDGAGEQIRVEVGGNVLDPAFRPSVRIDGSGGTAGQGQIGIPGLRLANSLKAIDVDEDRRFLIIFQVVEGFGSFELDQGSLFHAEIDPCGNPKWYLRVDSEGKAAIRFRLGAGLSHALVGIEQGRTDIFVVGPPEARLVQASNPAEETRGFVLEDLDSPQGDRRFLLEARVPIGLQGPVVAGLQSLDLSDDVLQPPQGAVAPASISAFALPSAGADPDNRFMIHRSVALAAYDKTSRSGEDTPSFPGGVQPIQVQEGGRLEITYNAAGFVFQDAKKQETRLTQTELFASVGATLGFSVREVGVAAPVLPATNSYDWTLTIDGAPVPADGMPFKNAHGSTLYVSFTILNDDLDAPGTGTNPILIKRLDTANPRGLLIVRAKIHGVGGDPQAMTIPIALRNSRPVDANEPFDKSTVATATAALRTDFGFFTDPANEPRFFDLELSQRAFARTHDATNLEAAKRIVYTEKQYVEDDVRVYALNALYTVWNYPGGFAEAALTPTLAPGSSSGGVLVFPEGHKLSKSDFALIINHHELVHVRDQSFLLRTGAASPALGFDYKAIMTDFIKTNLLREAEANREARARDYERAAGRLMALLGEVEAYAVQLKRSETEGSYFLARAAGQQLAKHYFLLMEFLKNGMPAAVNVAAFTQGSKPSEAMTETIIAALAGPNDRGGLFAYVPALFFKMKGDTIVFTGDWKNVVSEMRRDFDIVIPRMVYR